MRAAVFFGDGFGDGKPQSVALGTRVASTSSATGLRKIQTCEFSQTSQVLIETLKVFSPSYNYY